MSDTFQSEVCVCVYYFDKSPDGGLFRELYDRVELLFDTN